MKIRTRLASLFSSAIIALVSVTSINAFAATDPNGDGELDIFDAVYIEQYLDGAFEPSNLNDLDFDQNGIISSLDVEKIRLTLLGLMNGSSVNEVSNAAATVSSYNVYRARTGAYLRNYSLSYQNYNSSASIMESSKMESYSAPNVAGTNHVIGTDDRIEDYSNRFAAEILTENGLGSGFIVSSHVVATAAHCVFETADNTPSKVTDLLVFDNGTKINVTPVEYHVPTDFIGLSKYSAISDYALITVKEDLSQYIESPNYKFDLGSITDLASTSNHKLEVYTVGFPEVLNPGTPSEEVINDGEKYSERLSSGVITKVDENTFNFNADATPGHSGGAIYAREEFDEVERRVIIGMFVAYPTNDTTYNIGTRFTARELKFYNSNPNLKW